MNPKFQEPTTAVPPHADAFSAALGAEVRARRTLLGLNQTDVADLAGVSERFVRFVEQGKATVQLEPLLAVLGTLGLELAVRPAQVPAHSNQVPAHSNQVPAHSNQIPPHSNQIPPRSNAPTLDRP